MALKKCVKKIAWKGWEKLHFVHKKKVKNYEWICILWKKGEFFYLHKATKSEWDSREEWLHNAIFLVSRLNKSNETLFAIISRNFYRKPLTTNFVITSRVIYFFYSALIAQNYCLSIMHNCTCTMVIFDFDFMLTIARKCFGKIAFKKDVSVPSFFALIPPANCHCVEWMHACAKIWKCQREREIIFCRIQILRWEWILIAFYIHSSHDMLMNRIVQPKFHIIIIVIPLPTSTHTLHNDTNSSEIAKVNMICNEGNSMTSKFSPHAMILFVRIIFINNFAHFGISSINHTSFFIPFNRNLLTRNESN
jgi:hypothetical protein